MPIPWRFLAISAGALRDSLSSPQAVGLDEYQGHAVSGWSQRDLPAGDNSRWPQGVQRWASGELGASFYSVVVDDPPVVFSLFPPTGTSFSDNDAYRERFAVALAASGVPPEDARQLVNALARVEDTHCAYGGLSIKRLGWDGSSTMLVSVNSLAAPNYETPPSPCELSAVEPSTLDGMVSVDLTFKRKEEISFSDVAKFEIKITNISSMDIRAFTGVMTFADLFGRVKKRLRYTFDDPVSSGQTIIERNMYFDGNQFIDDDLWVMNTPLNNMLVSWETTAVILTDGTTLGEP